VGQTIESLFPNDLSAIEVFCRLLIRIHDRTIQAEGDCLVERCRERVDRRPCDGMRVVQIGRPWQMLREGYTNGARAAAILGRWEHHLPHFRKVAPHLALTEEGPQAGCRRTIILMVLGRIDASLVSQLDEFSTGG
jgi:hypothetical protein